MTFWQWLASLFRRRPIPVPVPAPTPPPPPAPVPAPSPDPISIVPHQLVAAVNSVRALRGLPLLVPDPALQRAADEWAGIMAAHDTMFGHDGSPDGRSFARRVADAGYPPNRATAENEAEGQPDVGAVMNSWLNSELHYDNIVGPAYRAFGGAMAVSKSGNMYWACEFGA
jgi:uncharacterized protein YkwD